MPSRIIYRIILRTQKNHSMNGSTSTTRSKLSLILLFNDVFVLFTSQQGRQTKKHFPVPSIWRSTMMDWHKECLYFWTTWLLRIIQREKESYTTWEIKFLSFDVRHYSTCFLYDNISSSMIPDVFLMLSKVLKIEYRPIRFGTITVVAVSTSTSNQTVLGHTTHWSENGIKYLSISIVGSLFFSLAFRSFNTEELECFCS